jgi:hypothetical protein
MRDPNAGASLWCHDHEGEGTRRPASNSYGVEEHERLIERVMAEQDEVLCILQLVNGDDELERRLFDQLVDLLVEGLFLDLRTEFLESRIDRDAYVEELANLADRCRVVGLLPLPSRGT